MATIRIPDFLFAQGTGHATAPAEAGVEAESALAAARSAEQEMTALNRGLGLASEALKGGGKTGKQIAAARDALGALGEHGAFRRLLGHAAAEQARREEAANRRTAMRTLIGAIKGVGSLPIPFAEKAELGRTLLQQGLERGLVAPQDHRLLEDAALSQFGLAQAQAALATAMEPGEALAIAEAAKADGVLQPSDSDLLDRQARERDAVAVARHRGRLAGKEAEDLAAFVRGELPEPLGEESFRLIHGARGATGAYARYQAARKEGEAIALIRGKDPEAIAEAASAWQGDAAVFAAALEKDAAERRRDPAGYALATLAGASTAYEETPAAEHGALLWSVQATAGIPEDQRSPWTLKETQSLARRWLALTAQPSGPARDDAMVTLLWETVLKLPPKQHPGAIAALEAQGLDAGKPGRLRATLEALQRGSLGAAYLAVNGQALHEPRATSSLPRSPQARPEEDWRPGMEPLSSDPIDAQKAEIKTERRSKRGTEGLANPAVEDPAFGGYSSDHAEAREAEIAGRAVPAWKDDLKGVVDHWARWGAALDKAGLGESQRFAMQEIFAAEGGMQGDGTTVAGITQDTLDSLIDMKRVSFPPGTRPADLDFDDMIEFYRAYFDAPWGSMGWADGFDTLESIGDKEMAAATADTFVRLPAIEQMVKEVVQPAIAQTIDAFPYLAEAFPSFVVDGKFGKISLQALQSIASSAEAKKHYLLALRNARETYMMAHEDSWQKSRTRNADGSVTVVLHPGEIVRIDHFLFQ